MRVPILPPSGREPGSSEPLVGPLTTVTVATGMPVEMAKGNVVRHAPGKEAR